MSTQAQDHRSAHSIFLNILADRHKLLIRAFLIVFLQLACAYFGSDENGTGIQEIT